MKSSVLTIMKKEFARFFSNKSSALIAILLPGLLIYAMWSIMGTALHEMTDAEEGKSVPIAVVHLPESIEAMGSGYDVEFVVLDQVPDREEIKKEIEAEAYRAVMVFPEDFDADVAVYDTAAGAQAPQVEIFYDTTNVNSSAAFALATTMLDGYESALANRFDINAGSAEYDVSDEQSRAAMFMVSIVPMLLLVLLFSGCMSVAAESIAGEKERGTMATMLATPIRRRDIALGKIFSLTIIGMLIAASSAIGIFASLPNLSQGELDINIYGVTEYALLALVILATTLVIVMLIALVSALAKTTKEAQVYLTPLMVVVVGVGLLGMFGDGAQSSAAYYLIPLYNSVQCMIGIFTFDFEPMNVIICIVSNLVYTGIGVAVLQGMFKSERLMFAR